MVIRQASTQDLKSLVQFNQAMAMETEGKELDGEILTAGVSRLLSDPEKGFYLVAEKDGEIAGSLMVTFEWSDWRNGTFWWIQSVYIVPQFRRQGIYSALYEAVKKRAQDHQVCGFRLYVESDNTRAQKTYEHLGMSHSHYLMFESQ